MHHHPIIRDPWRSYRAPTARDPWHPRRPPPPRWLDPADDRLGLEFLWAAIIVAFLWLLWSGILAEGGTS